MEEKKPLVSIVTVCLNSEKHIEQTILSVINQTYSPIEYIIIDGGSTDKTLDIIKKYQDKISTVISEKDEGIYDAMNKGIKKANGEIIGIINSDDWYEKDAVEKIIKEYLSKEKPGVIHGNVNIYQNDNFIQTNKPNTLAESKMNFAKHPTCFVPKKLYEQYGKFSTNYKIVSDVDFLLRLKKGGVKFYYLPITISNFRLNGASDKIWNNSLETFKLYKKHFSIFTAIKIFFRRTILKQTNETLKKLFGEKIRKKISKIYNKLFKK